jgi:hypothetical protein
LRGVLVGESAKVVSKFVVDVKIDRRERETENDENSGGVMMG